MSKEASEEREEESDGSVGPLLCYKSDFFFYRYRMIFIFLGFSFLLHMPLLFSNLIWSKVASKYSNRWLPPPKPELEYYWLIIYPGIVFAHSILAGVICESLYISA